MLPGRELNADFVLKVLRKRRWLVVFPLFLGVLGGLLYSRSQPSLYRSDAVVQVVPQRIPDTYVQSTVTARVEERLSSIAQQVLSRTQLEAVILQFDLYPDERKARPMEDVIELMRKNVQVVPEQGTRQAARNASVDAFRISFDYSDARVCRDVVARLAGFFIDQNAKERGAQAGQASAFLEGQLASARSDLLAQEKKREEFRERNAGRLPTEMQTNMQAITNTQMALQALVESLARDRDRKLVLERMYNDAAAEAVVVAPAPTAPAGSRSGDAGALAPGAPPRQRLEAARALLAQLKLRYEEKHPDVRSTRTLIADLERQVAAEELQAPLSPEAGAAEPRPATPEEARRREKLREQRAEIESLAGSIAFKESEERRMRGEIAMYQKRLEAVPGVESEWIALTRDYDTLYEKYKDLLSKSENSKMAASLEDRQIGEQFKILDPPRLPVKPASPNRLKINFVGLLAGLGLAVVLVGFLEYRDASMLSEADARRATGLPVLVLVPYVATDADLRRDRSRRMAASLGVAGVAVVTGILFWFLQLWKYVI